MNLEGSAASLLEQFPDGSRSELQRQEKLLERFGNIAFTGFGLVIFLAICGMIYWIITKTIMSGEQPLAGILLIAFLVFAALSLGYVIRRESLNEQRAKLANTPAPPTDFPGATTRKLVNESTIEPVPSVVENTTELLKQPRNR
ncbi:MAG: hypothetical protein ACKVQW_07160 [Pyrinomonadaceae bacterium]